jgi:hypothetical protein
MHEGLVPDVSLGTHFFNDLVEFDMQYMALYPERRGNMFNEQFFLNAPNVLIDLVPDAAPWVDTVKVIDNMDTLRGTKTILSVDSMNQKAVCYLQAGY